MSKSTDDMKEQTREYLAELLTIEPDAIDPEDLGGVYRDDWEKGEPCPECGSTHTTITSLSDNLYRVSNQEGQDYEFRGNGDELAVGEYVCTECEEVLYRDPGVAILRRLRDPIHP